jgi:hypothetical protein
VTVDKIKHKAFTGQPVAKIGIMRGVMAFDFRTKGIPRKIIFLQKIFMARGLSERSLVFSGGQGAKSVFAWRYVYGLGVVVPWAFWRIFS